MDSRLLLHILIGLLPFLIATYILYITWLRSKYPPGPYPLPVIGNLHLLSKKLHVSLAKLAKIYGPVYTLWIGAQPTVILCDMQVVKEVTVQKGVEFAGKAMDSNGYKVVFQENEDLLTRSYDSKVELMRKLSLSIMNIKAIGGLSAHKIVEEEMLILLQRLKKMNGKVLNLRTVLDLPLSNVIMRSIFGFRFEGEEDPAFLRWTKANEAMKEAVMKCILVSLAPVIWYLFPWMKKSIYHAALPYNEFTEYYLNQHEETYQEGIIRDFTDVVIKHVKDQNNEQSNSASLTRLNVIQLLKNLIGGGSQNVLGSIRWCFLVLLHCKDIQVKIHQELDQYVLRKYTEQKEEEKTQKDQYGVYDDGPHHLQLLFSDRPNLPYFNAFLYETFRRCSVTVLSSPRKALVDTSVGGYPIRKDTAVIYNAYACHMDEKIWERPMEFMPERFLDINGSLDYSKTKLVMHFGAGPRSCVGEKLARVDIFVCLVNVLLNFEVSCPSMDILPSLDNGCYALVHDPEEFEVILTLREATKAEQ